MYQGGLRGNDSKNYIFYQLTEAVKDSNDYKIEALLRVCKAAEIDSSMILFRFECAYNPICNPTARKLAKKRFDDFGYNVKGRNIMQYEYDQRGDVSTVQLVDRTPEGSG